MSASDAGDERNWLRGLGLPIAEEAWVLVHDK
jgi:hypothetical protein